MDKNELSEEVLQKIQKLHDKIHLVIRKFICDDKLSDIEKFSGIHLSLINGLGNFFSNGYDYKKMSYDEKTEKIKAYLKTVNIDLIYFFCERFQVLESDIKGN